jgi:hypothetical protein
LPYFSIVIEFQKPISERYVVESIRFAARSNFRPAAGGKCKYKQIKKK